jgi:hypothetical protein
MMAFARKSCNCLPALTGFFAVVAFYDVSLHFVPGAQVKAQEQLSSAQATIAGQDFDRVISGGDTSGAYVVGAFATDVVRRQLKLRLRLIVDCISSTGELTAAQREKLTLAGQGDIKRAIDRLDDARKRVQFPSEDDAGIMRNDIRQQAELVRKLVDSETFGEKSLLAKTRRKMLTAEQEVNCATLCLTIQAIEPAGGRISMVGMDSEGVEIRLSGILFPDESLASLSGITNLRRLFLNKTRVADDGLVHLHALKEIEVLDLSETAISDAGLIHLKALAKLRRLDLTKTRVTGEGIADLKMALPDLTVNR